MKKFIFLMVFAALSIAAITVVAQDTTIHPPVILIDSASIQAQVDHAIAQLGQGGVTVFGWHTTWFIFIVTVLVALEVITRMIPGLSPFNKWITDAVKYINEHWNKK